MNTLFLTLLYHPDDVAMVLKHSRDGIQNQINAYQWAFHEGLEKNLLVGESLSICNALPVGVYPKCYRKLWLRGKTLNHGKFKELPSLNLPYVKQKMRAWLATRSIEQWIAASPENRNILVYSMYLPYLQAIARIKRKHADVRATLIITDLPNDQGIASGRKGLLKRIEYAMGRKKTKLCSVFDGFVLLTRHMAEVLPINGKPSLVLEGLISPEPVILKADLPTLPADDRPAVLYTGTLNRELGIGELLEAFKSIDSTQLWLCGNGDMQFDVQAAAERDNNIHYFGFVPQPVALALQKRAFALINPRTAQGAFTRYSFPSKTMEYMRSGKPVLCCKLDGIPDAYDDYLLYIAPQNSSGIKDAVVALLALSQEARLSLGERARAFVLTEKNSEVQGRKLSEFMRGLHA